MKKIILASIVSLCIYGVYSYFFDQFKRHLWEASGGVNIYIPSNEELEIKSAGNARI